MQLAENGVYETGFSPTAEKKLSEISPFPACQHILATFRWRENAEMHIR